MAAGGQHGDFQTFLDFEKTPALGDLLIVFSKITQKRLYLGKLYEESENFEIVAGFSIFTETGS